MSLKFAILGLVEQQGPLSGYDIKGTIERSIFYIWNVTGAQIYNALRDMREKGLLTAQTVAQEGRPDKRMHEITDAGRAALAEEADAPIRDEALRDKVLLRVFFGNQADPEAMAREIEAYMARIVQEIDYLENVERRVLANPGSQHAARHFQLLSLRLKVAQLRGMEEEFRRAGYDQPDAVSPDPETQKTAEAG
jgi:DNA-binding PadR family transcriptional regulator